MTIVSKKEGTELTVALSGRLDTSTSPELEKFLNESLDGVTDLKLELGGMDYISSAGLRVLLGAHRRMKPQGKMTLTGVNETVMEIFDLTGFSDILTIL